MKKYVKFALIFIALAVAVSGVFWGPYLLSLHAYKNALNQITYTRTDAAGIPDGSYIGDCDARFIYAKVSVTVKNNTMTDIALLEYRHDRGAAAVRIVKDMLDAQRLDVDVIAGATSSCRVIRKAVDAALSGAA